MSTPPTLTELNLTPEMLAAVNSAFGSQKPLAVAYVDEDDTPRLSYRGSTQAYSPTQLAIWVRNPAGGILDATKRNPAISLIYGNFDPASRGFMIFRGRARIDADPAVRKRVYDNAHEFERNQDKDRKGVALVIDLDAVDGFFGGARLAMRRE
jgi:hypothetical protein